ncbi:MAG TPA: rRNA maturation RNase YbeY [candidate division Zixibacteria bacterium]|nr:rRNA maturation RNase YbeY [candidate division Zixibacteria bacterium]
MKLTIHKETPVRAPRAALTRLTESVSRGELAPRGAEVNLVFVSDATQRRLNREYRQIDKTTDVLSFAYPVDARSRLFAEIYISAPQAKRQAREFRHSLAQEILRLHCHGLLHALGFDHDTESAARRMSQREERYLAQAMRR